MRVTWSSLSKSGAPSRARGVKEGEAHLQEPALKGREGNRKELVGCMLWVTVMFFSR